MTDPLHCGACDHACELGVGCVEGRCLVGCVPGTVEDCYDGQDGTLGVGPCVGGTRTCDETGNWSRCTGQVVPVPEDCGDGIDNNCNGMVDEDVDEDGDGYTSCGGDCCDSTECVRPELVNPGAFDAPGNNLDDDCNGVVDDTLLLCDQNIDSNTTDAMELARAIDICQVATLADRNWGVIDGKITVTDGGGVPDKAGYSVRPTFGAGVFPQGGVNLAVLSTGTAAAIGDVNPAHEPFVEGYHHIAPHTAPFPADFLAANGGKLPNAPGCPQPTGGEARDPVMLTLRLRVPTNARSFRLAVNFFSSEFPEYACSPFNDFFVVLLDSMYDGPNPNPVDKNLAFYQPMDSSAKIPIGVNLAYGNTGLFTQCVNGRTGCRLGANSGSIASCRSTSMLVGTGFDLPSPGNCGPNSMVGGATGWLVTAGNVVPGEIITLRVAIWDTSDQDWDSLAVIDGFQWSTELAQPGTVIF